MDAQTTGQAGGALLGRPEIISALIAAVAAFTGALIGGPLLERFKDRLGASRSWSSRKAEIVATLRLVLAQCDAFLELFDSYQNIQPRTPAVAAQYRAAMSSFGIAAALAPITGLTYLDPDFHQRSSAGQHL